MANKTTTAKIANAAAKKNPAAKNNTAKKHAPVMGANTAAARTDWFTKARFGMFIHWGLYALPARHEWIRHNEKITDEDYQKYFDAFNPDLFDPKEWAAAAKGAGMKYVVLTTKHHDGFCLFDSKFTDYKATKTPFGRDIVKEFVAAFRAEGIKIGFYYSLLDWHHPDFVIDNRIGPYRDAPNRAEMNKGRDQKKYAKYMRDQVGELLTNYGKVDILWFDFSYPSDKNNPEGKGRDDWESEKLYALVRKLQPHVIVDNRLDLPGSGDIHTPEQYTPVDGIKDENGAPVVWEGCQTFSGAWGYHRDESTFKSPKQCVEMLVNHVSRGGNLLMNVGPTGRGYIDDRALDRLDEYGFWMKYNSRSIYDCTLSPFAEPEHCRYTYNAETKRLYLHLFSYPFKDMILPGLAGKIKYAQFLHDASELHFSVDGSVWGTNPPPEGSVRLELPVIQPDVLVPVVEIFLND